MDEEEYSIEQIENEIFCARRDFYVSAIAVLFTLPLTGYLVLILLPMILLDTRYFFSFFFFGLPDLILIGSPGLISLHFFWKYQNRWIEWGSRKEKLLRAKDINELRQDDKQEQIKKEEATPEEMLEKFKKKNRSRIIKLMNAACLNAFYYSIIGLITAFYSSVYFPYGFFERLLWSNNPPSITDVVQNSYILTSSWLGLIAIISFILSYIHFNRYTELKSRI